MVDDADYSEIIKYKWCACYNVKTKSYYACRRGKISDRERLGKTIYLHREIMNPVKGFIVDHIDHNTLNNTRLNIRICTNSQNMRNRGKQSNNTSGYKGVGWNKQDGKWQAQININGKNTGIGRFKCKHEAARAYNLAARMYHGEFAYTNIIKEDL